MRIRRTNGPQHPSEGRTLPRRSRSRLELLSFGALLATSVAVRADTNSYAVMLQNNATMQANLTKQMINLGGTRIGGSGASTAPASPAPCLPPFELQRGVDGHVPPELQGDPRYQAYLRCVQSSPSARDVRTTPQPPALPSGAHLPITATDFVPARPGRPFVDQAIAGMALTPEQRTQLRNGAEEMFRRVAATYRGNNVAVSVTVAYSNGSEMNPQQTREFVFGVNDRLARNPRFASMTPLEKQNESDRLIFQGFVVAVLRDLGTRDPHAKAQAMELARSMMKQFNGA
jgi:hypothetical protein